jgi:hypothetical protein
MPLTEADKAIRATGIGASEAWKVVEGHGAHDVFLRLVHPHLLVPEDESSGLPARKGQAPDPSRSPTDEVGHRKVEGPRIDGAKPTPPLGGRRAHPAARKAARRAPTHQTDARGSIPSLGSGLIVPGRASQPTAIKPTGQRAQRCPMSPAIAAGREGADATTPMRPIRFHPGTATMLGRGVTPSREPVNGFGGCNLRLAQSSRSEEANFAAVSSALRRWFLVNEIAPDAVDLSPRIDARKLVTELLTRRAAMGRCRREELAPGQFAVLVDVSGSCAVACRTTMAAAQRLMADMSDRVGLIVHSNGVATEVAGRAAAWSVPIGSDLAGWATRTHVRLSGAMWLGDFHGIDTLSALVRRCPVVVINDTMSSAIGARVARRQEAAELVAALGGLTPKAHFEGVRGARDIADALLGRLK